MRRGTAQGGGSAAFAMAVAALLSGCSSMSGGDESGGGTFGGLFGGGKPAAAASAPGSGAPSPAASGFAASDPSIPCPPAEINPGTGSYRIYEAGKAGDVMAVRYQAEIDTMARECSGLGAEMAMKVGIKGRVIVGAKGGPGQVTVPLRIAVADGRNQPVYSQLRQVTVVIQPGATDAGFTHVEDGVLVPVDDSKLRNWHVYAGFDEQAGPAKKAKPKSDIPDIKGGFDFRDPGGADAN